ncbi:MAG: c-type cytochrome [Candidatus Competibacterales bacterium]|nr:c-type cytochrome [Candidatus Competibacterales bacterium]
MRVHTVLKLLAAGCCGILLSGAQAQEGDPQAGKYAFTTCSGCHAVPGYTNAYPTYHVPRLGGQNAQYIASALQAYKAGQRDHQTMQANAYDLSEADLRDIGAYLAGFELSDDIPPVRGSAAAGRAKAQDAGCAACHGENGREPTQPTYPKLAGQYEDYLVKSLEDYRSGARQQAIMNGIAGGLSDQDIAHLAAYYASQSPGLATIEFHGRE